jgi:cellulose synthase/poly-beta-1,6-N-acetylglucosamine synthase-like glycosyltransferase
MNILEPQKTTEVEILVEVDDGKKTIGQKRNELLKKSRGDFICFCDDDDLVSKDYIPKILNAIKSNPDCCGIEGMMSIDGKNPKKFIHSLKYSTWFEKKGIYYRCVNHLNPVRRSLAMKVKFPNVSVYEDRSYSMRMRNLVKTEEYIDGVIYYYLYRRKKKGIEERNKNV